MLEEVDFIGGGVFLEEVFFCWRKSLFLEEVDFVGGGVFFWRKCFLLEEVMCVLEQGGTNGPPYKLEASSGQEPGHVVN